MRIDNFSPGPSMLPEAVLQQAQEALLNYKNTGLGIAEISHRSALFEDVLMQTMQDFKTLLNIPSTHHVLFTQGGAIGQNSLIPFNLLKNQTKANYAVTGHWSQKSYTEASRYGAFAKINCVNHAQNTNFDEWKIEEDAAYLHFCSNETVDGIQLFDIPKTNVPLVVDMSSDILSRQIDVSRYGVIYGGAQKNIGISGLTFLIVSDDLLDRHLDICPKAFEWRTIVEYQSMWNTPATFPIFIAHLVFKHWLSLGGLAVVEEKNQKKAKLLYDYIDQSALYINKIPSANRSWMNVIFNLRDENLNQAFLDGALKHHLSGLKGHKAVGGMRASIYNAMSIEGVERLIDYMKAFEQHV